MPLKSDTGSAFSIAALASDLDGTLIPLADHDAARAALTELASARQVMPTPLLYVTGRHLESVLDAIIDDGIPVPDWILCDVGTSVYRNVDNSKRSTPWNPAALAAAFERQEAYDEQLDRLTHQVDNDVHRHAIGRLPEFQLQESFKQGRHKLSYYVPAERLEACHRTVEDYLNKHNLPYGIISSVDPFNGDGLVDVLPRAVSKAYALDWWCGQHEIAPERVIFCGDSGNDTAALVAGYRAVLVGNADRGLAAEVHRVHQDKQLVNHLVLASGHSTAGVVEGAKWFGWLPEDEPETCRHFGARPVAGGATEFRLFAPDRDEVTLQLVQPIEREISMQRDSAGFHTARVADCHAGQRYWFRVAESTTIPDPASRFQPDGIHAASEVIRPQYPWQFSDTPRITRREELIPYELHIGSFTDQGTFLSAIERLDELVDLGVTAIEMMPIAQCPGRWNWGYDSTYWFAPMNTFGRPDDLRKLVDEAHRRGLTVIVDVVYNHFGPEGNYWHLLGDYVSDKHQTPWGGSPNFDDGESAQWIRQFVIDNAIMWLDEYQIDGLRVDAIHCMADDSPEHISRSLGEQVRRWADENDRRVWLIAESNVYDPWMIADSPTGPDDEADFEWKGGQRFDAQWCDDFVHSLLAVLRPEDQLTNRAYRRDVDLSRMFRRGFVFQGDVRHYRGREVSIDESLADTQPTRVDTSGLVYCIQNHDFIGNHPLGQRLHQLTSKSTQAAAAGMLMMMPAVPMVFMGEEFACERPFSFFVDFGDEGLRKAVVEGRRREYPQHDWSDGVLPIDPEAFQSSKIGEIVDGDPAMRDWYKSLISLRRRCVEAGLLGNDRFEVFSRPDQRVHRVSYRDAERALHVIARFESVADPDAVAQPVRLAELSHLHWPPEPMTQMGTQWSLWDSQELESPAVRSTTDLSTLEIGPNQTLILLQGL